MILMSEKEILEEKIKEKKDTQEYIDKMVSKSVSELKNLAQAEHNHEKKHSHATHKYDKFCPGCGDKNPDFDPEIAYCTDCGSAVGSVKEVKNEEIKACPGCGSSEAVVTTEAP